MQVNAQVVKQSVKWVVYSLLLVNFALYLNWDWHGATHALGPAEPLIMGTHAPMGSHPWGQVGVTPMGSGRTLHTQSHECDIVTTLPRVQCAT